MKLFISAMLLICIITGTVNGRTSNEKLAAFKKSVVSEEIGDYESAIEELTKIYKNYSDDYLINLRLGWLNYLKKDYEASQKYYNKAIKICDGCIESLLGITYPLSALNKWDDIENVYKKILDIDENNYAANLNLGKINYNSASYLNAKIYLEKIYENFPSDVDALVYLGWTYFQLGNSSKANELFTDALINAPENSSALEGLNSTK